MENSIKNNVKYQLVFPEEAQLETLLALCCICWIWLLADF